MAPYDPTGWEFAHGGLIGKPGPHQGKALLFRTQTNDGQDLYLWDPASPTPLEIANGGHPVLNQFCSGHTWDRDGDLVIAGGERNTQCDRTEPNWSYVFFPDSLLWQLTPDLLFLQNPQGDVGHYYPSVITLSDGRSFMAGGSTAPFNSTVCGLYNPPQTDPIFYRADEHQVFDKTSWSWIGMPSGFAVPGLGTTPPLLGFHQYPLLHLLSTGHVFGSVVTWGGYDSALGKNFSPSAYTNVSTGAPSSWTWSLHSSRIGGANPAVNLFYPTAFLWPWTVGQAVGTDRVVVIGGADWNKSYQPAPPPPTPPGRPAEAAVWEMQSPTAPTATWNRPAVWGTLNKPRIYANVVILPDMSAVVFGGSRNHFAPYALTSGVQEPQVAPQPVYQPERLDLLNPQAGWQLLEPHESPRLYHALAVLLQDGRVLVPGGYKKTQQTAPSLVHTDAEVFLPDYLRWAVARPQIVNPPATLTYGQTLTLAIALAGAANPAAEIEYAILIRCASVTHHFDWDQRAIVIPVQSANGNQLNLQPFLTPLPSSSNAIAPPGYYMLFAVTKNTWGGVNTRFPSVAAFVQVM